MAAKGSSADGAAGHRSFRSALHAVADALTAHGFAAHMADGEQTTDCASSTTTARSATVAIDNPVICAVDRGMVRGMLSALYVGGPRRRHRSQQSPRRHHLLDGGLAAHERSE